MKLRHLAAVLGASLAVIGVSRDGKAASSCISGSNLEEKVVFNLYGCRSDLFLAIWAQYRLTDRTWNENGLLDACNIDMPFAKMVNAAFLLNYALSDDYIPQWHSLMDYRLESVASTHFHGPYFSRILMSRGTGPLAVADLGRFLATDRISYYCELFNFGAPNDSVVERAATVVHEAWHHWQKAKNYRSAHPRCRGIDCDYYYFHGSGQFEFGTLNSFTRDGRYFHSPYQIGVEFLADLAEHSKGWVPVLVTQAARARANNRISRRFVNAVPWRVGQPRPF